MDEMNSRVAAVTVFPDRARVTRTLSLEVTPGLKAVEFSGLPVALDPASVRASAEGSATATLLGVEVRKTFFGNTPSEQVRALEEHLETLQDQQQQSLDRLETLKKQLDHLDGLLDSTRTYAFALSNGKTNLESHAALLDFIEDRRARSKEANRTLKRDQSRQEKEIDKLLRELEQLQNARPRQRYTAIIDFDIHTQGALDVSLEYILPGCSWKPTYDLRFSGEALEVHYLGQVQQTTGENWQEVSLTLSTAYPSLTAVVPELTPWYLSEFRPPASREAMSLESPVRAAAAMPAPAPAPKSGAPDTAAALEAQVEQSGAAVNYIIKKALDLPGDGSTRKITITRIELEPTLDYVTTPKIAEAAYRRVTVENNSAYMLLPGRAQLFEGANYLGTTTLELTSPGQELELFFGADDRVRVKRELIRHEMDKSLIGERRRVRFAYQIDVENHTGKSQKVVVRDQVPIGRHEEIKVKLERTEPRQPAQDELNRLEWELHLEDAQKQTLRFDFTVEHPRTLMVIGLP